MAKTKRPANTSFVVKYYVATAAGEKRPAGVTFHFLVINRTSNFVVASGCVETREREREREREKQKDVVVPR